MTDAENVETPEVSFSLSGERLTLRDEAGGGEVLVELDGDTSLTRATTSWFDVPMDAAVSFEAESMRFPHNTAGWARGADGESHGIFTEERTRLCGGTFIDLSAAMKVVAYIEDGPCYGYSRKEPGADGVLVEFDSPSRVVLGARSIHEEPTATVTVPEDPTALMAAVSHLGSSMKEWSAERSWSTLRGHPPAIRTGETLSIPDRLSPPDTGVTVAVPERIADVYRVAPLAHYFGAEVVPGERPELRLETGYTEALGTGRALEQSVDELTARGLVLDSLVRIGGYYSLPRWEYEELAPDLPFYPPELYDRSVDRQLLEYLEVHFSVVEPYLPEWPVTATIRPTVTDAEALPHLLNSFARIRVADNADPLPALGDGSGIRLSTSRSVPPGTASLPRSGRQAALAYERRPPERSSVLVVGDERPDERCFKRTNWDSHEVDGDVLEPEYRSAVSRTELAEALRGDPLYVHYGGEVTEEGFVCTDGVLPFDAVPPASVGAISFTPPETGAGASSELLGTAAVVCLSERPLSPASVEAFAKYLVLGFPPHRSAAFAAIDDRLRYFGDASLSLTDHANGTLPAVFDADPVGDGTYELSFCCHVARPDGLGSTVYPQTEKTRDIYYLIGSSVSVQTPYSIDDLAQLCAGDHLLRIGGPVPDEVPTESVIHASRTDWGDDGSVGAPESSRGAPFSDSW